MATAAQTGGGGRGGAAGGGVLKLYSNPVSRGAIVEWYIKELGLEVDMVIVEKNKKLPDRGADFLAATPFGKLPAITDGDFSLFESGAILLYLSEVYGGKLSPASPRARAALAQWVFFSSTTLCEAYYLEMMRDWQLPAVLGPLDKLLEGREFLEGGAFSAADVALGSHLLWLDETEADFQLGPYPAVRAYLDRMTARPACQETAVQMIRKYKANPPVPSPPQ